MINRLQHAHISTTNSCTFLQLSLYSDRLNLRVFPSMHFYTKCAVPILQYAVVVESLCSCKMLPTKWKSELKKCPPTACILKALSHPRCICSQGSTLDSIGERSVPPPLAGEGRLATYSLSTSPLISACALDFRFFGRWVLCNVLF